jgi:hypothetical protein
MDSLPLHLLIGATQAGGFFTHVLVICYSQLIVLAQWPKFSNRLNKHLNGTPTDKPTVPGLFCGELKA